VSNTRFHVARILGALQWLVAGAVIVSATGCANLGGLPGFSLGSNGEPAPISGPNGVCTVEVHGRGKPNTTSVPLTAESRIQDVLEASGADRTFRKMKVHVVRQSPRNPEEKVRLSSQFDPKTNKISMATDYAVMSGDKIVVVEDKTTKLDETLGAMLPF
jgi:hypothetical protein